MTARQEMARRLSNLATAMLEIFTCRELKEWEGKGMKRPAKKAKGRRGQGEEKGGCQVGAVELTLYFRFGFFRQ